MTIIDMGSKDKISPLGPLQFVTPRASRHRERYDGTIHVKNVYLRKMTDKNKLDSIINRVKAQRYYI